MLDRNTHRLARLVAVPLSMGSCGLTALLLAAGVQRLSGQALSAGALALPVVLGALVGTAAALVRILTEAERP